MKYNWEEKKTQKIPLSKQFKNRRNRGKIDTSNIHIHDRLLSWLGTGTSMKCGGIKLVFWTQTSPLREMLSRKCFPRVRTMLSITNDNINMCSQFDELFSH
jgi:hypothetical protein